MWTYIVDTYDVNNWKRDNNMYFLYVWLLESLKVSKAIS